MPTKLSSHDKLQKEVGRTFAGYSPERLTVGLLGTVTLCLVNIPWILGCLISHPGQRFIGTAYNISDFENYLSWLQQTSHNHVVLRNLFTTLPQHPMQVNLLFALLGAVVHLSGLSPEVVYQLCRVFAGTALLAVVWRFIRACFPNSTTARVSAFFLVCFGNGLGWVSAARWADLSPAGSPVEAWQPEAFTFQSLETSTLFCVSTTLIIGAIALMIAGEIRRKARYAVGAGICLAVLGNIHTYDVLHVTAAWTLYLICRALIVRDTDLVGSMLRALIAFFIMLPTAAYEFYVFNTDPIFHLRVGVQTLSPAFTQYMLCYAPLLILGIVFLILTLVRWVRTINSAHSGSEEDFVSPFSNRIVTLALTTWAVAGLAVCYLPVAFQRKMLMGENIPLSLLAGAGSAAIVRALPGWKGWTIVCVLIAITVPSPLLFMARDVRHIVNDRSEEQGFKPFISADTDDMLHWIDDNTSRSDAFVGIPLFSGIIPAETGRPVWSGHWGETPHFSQTFEQFFEFANAATSEGDRKRFLISTRCSYLWIPRSWALAQPVGAGTSFTDFSADTPPYLILVHQNNYLLIYRIDQQRLKSTAGHG